MQLGQNRDRQYLFHYFFLYFFTEEIFKEILHYLS